MVIFIAHAAMLYLCIFQPISTCTRRRDKYITHRVLGISRVCSRIDTRAYGTGTNTATDS